MDKLLINGFKIDAIVGVYDSEKTKAQKIQFDLEIELFISIIPENLSKINLKLDQIVNTTPEALNKFHHGLYCGSRLKVVSKCN